MIGNMTAAVLMSLLFMVSEVAAAEAGKTFVSEGMKFRVETLLQRKDVLWGFDFLADGRVVLTERGGKLLLFDPEKNLTVEIMGVPKVEGQGQGGLLDVRVHPTKGDIFLTYVEAADQGITTALGHARLEGHQLAGFKKIFSAQESNSNTIHFGSRIVFKDKHIFFSVGDRNRRSAVQDLGHHTGKILRLREDGAIPPDNPFVKKADAKGEVWSYGHRNPQGLALHPTTGELWEAEMGPRGGDELNLIQRGANYGWPVVTFGREYYGPKIGEGTEKAGMTSPVAYWVPSISPSAIGFYQAEPLSKWKGNLFMACLSGQHLRRLTLKDGKVIVQEELLKELGWRFRNVRQGPDGFLYFSTDDGKFARLTPVS